MAAMTSGIEAVTPPTKHQRETENDKHRNECECAKGWEGDAEGTYGACGARRPPESASRREVTLS